MRRYSRPRPPSMPTPDPPSWFCPVRLRCLLTRSVLTQGTLTRCLLVASRRSIRGDRRSGAHGAQPSRTGSRGQTASTGRSVLALPSLVREVSSYRALPRSACSGRRPSQWSLPSRFTRVVSPAAPLPITPSQTLPFLSQPDPPLPSAHRPSLRLEPTDRPQPEIRPHPRRMMRSSPPPPPRSSPPQWRIPSPTSRSSLPPYRRPPPHSSSTHRRPRPTKQQLSLKQQLSKRLSKRRWRRRGRGKRGQPPRPRARSLAAR